jgi:calcium-dependent protein kinase
LVLRLKKYRGVSHLKRAAINLLVKMTNEEEIAPLAEQFRLLDKDGTGLITSAELSQFMKEKSQNLTEEQISSIMKELDYQGNGKINYTEFLSATLNIQTIITDARMRSLFNVFDTDASGFIT